MPKVHASAIVSEQAELAPDVEIGPYCVLEGPVTLGPGVRLMGHNHVQGPATIGEGSTMFPYASVGLAPQHLGYTEGDPVGGVSIGANVTLRESTTVHQAWKLEHPTIVGDGTYLMLGAHVGHDTVIGKNCIICNNAAIAGHVEIADRVYISGLVAIHQFCRIGRLAMISGGLAMSVDMPPFCTSVLRNRTNGINLVGMRRAGIDRLEIRAVRDAYGRAFKGGLTRHEQLEILAEIAEQSACVREMHDFIEGVGKRGITRGDGRLPAAQHNWVVRFVKDAHAGHLDLDSLEEAPAEEVG